MNEDILNEELVQEVAEREIMEAVLKKADEASPVREKIITELKPMVKVNKKDFATTVLGATHKGEELKKEEKKEMMKQLSWEFDKARDFIFNQGDEEKPDKVETLMKQVACCVKWLELAGHGHLWKYWQDRYGLEISVKESKECNTFRNHLTEEDDFDAEDFILNSFKSASNTMVAIREAEEDIKVSLFSELPEDVVYSKENKRGIKPAQFDSIVTVKALRNIEEEKATKKANSLADNALDNIAVSRIMFNLIEPETAQ